MVRAAWWLAAAALAAGCATDGSISDGSHIGKVQGVYVEQYSGVFVDRQAATADAGKPLWVYVTFDRPLQNGSRFATAILERNPGIEAGDLVEVRLAEDAEPRDGANAHSQVTALIAKHDTARARSFGSAPAPVAQTLRQANMDLRP